MCRHLVYLGPEVTLDALLLTPEHGLLTQSWAPRHQTHGVVNADGFGVGWYDDARAEPAVYRRAQPMWGDASFASIAGVIRTGAVLASVRSATPGFPVDESSVHPFASGPWLFAHNGVVDGFNEGVNVDLRARLSRTRAAAIRSATDSEVLFALALDRLDAGAAPGEALAAVIATVKEIAGGRLNMVLTDGRRAAATACGASLFLRSTPGITLASEPFGGDDGWDEVPDLCLAAFEGDEVLIEPL